MVQYKNLSRAIVIGLGLLTSACGGPLNKDAKNQIKERVSEEIYLSFPDEDSRKTYKDWGQLENLREELLEQLIHIDQTMINQAVYISF